MSASASQAHAFYRDVASTRRVWTVRDPDGFPAPIMRDGMRAMPFWSSLSRVEKIITTVASYNGFQAVELSFEVFRDRWLKGLKRDGLLVGVNWSGDRAVGYDIEPEDVLSNIEYYINPDTSG